MSVMRNSYVANPFLASAAIFSTASLLALLPFSDLYPAFTMGFALFLLLTIGINAALFYVTRGYAVTGWVETTAHPRLSIILPVAAILLAANLAYPDQVPILAGVSGGYQYSVKDIELMPVGYPLASAFFFFFGCQFFYHYLLRYEKKYLALFCMFLLFHVIFVQRGFVISQIVTAAIMGLIRRGGITKRHLAIGTVGALCILVVFGWLGSLRDSAGKYYRPIEEIGGASAQFRETRLPSNVFYIWLYLTSPLANFQENVNCGEVRKPQNAFGAFLATEVVPDVLSKRLTDTAQIEADYRDCRISPSLNVGTLYNRAYTYLGWVGASLMFAMNSIMLLFLFRGFIRLKQRHSPYLVFATAYAATFSAMTVFDNMLPNSARLLPLILPFALDVASRVRFRAGLERVV